MREKSTSKASSSLAASPFLVTYTSLPHHLSNHICQIPNLESHMSSHTRHHTHLLSFKSHLQLACIEITHLSVTCWSRALLHVSIQLCLSTVDLHFNQAPIHEMESKNDTHGLLICFWKKHFEKISQKNCNFITPIISSQGHRIKLEPKVPSKQHRRNLKTQLYFYV